MYATEDAAISTNLVILLPFPSLLIRFTDATSYGCLRIVNGGTESSSSSDGARYTDRQSDAVQSFAFRYKEASSGRPRCEQPTLDFASGARALDRTGRLRLKISYNKTLTLVRKRKANCANTYYWTWIYMKIDVHSWRNVSTTYAVRNNIMHHEDNGLRKLTRMCVWRETDG